MTLNDFLSAIAGISGLLFVVTSVNFSGTNTLPFVLVGVVLMLLLLLPFAKFLGKRSEAATAPEAQAA